MFQEGGFSCTSRTQQTKGYSAVRRQNNLEISVFQMRHLCKTQKYFIPCVLQMDLLRTMVQNREASGMSMRKENVKKTTKKPQADDGIPPGTKRYRDYIVAKKPNHKKLKAHFNAMVEKLTESDSEVDTD